MGPAPPDRRTRRSDAAVNGRADATKVGFVGLGQMGRAMAGRLLEAGHELVVYNRSPGPAQALAAQGAKVAADARGVLDSEVIITMLADDAAIEAV